MSRSEWDGREVSSRQERRERCANLAIACRNPPFPLPVSPTSRIIIALCCTFFLRIYLFSFFFFRLLFPLLQLIAFSAAAAFPYTLFPGFLLSVFFFLWSARREKGIDGAARRPSLFWWFGVRVVVTVCIRSTYVFRQSIAIVFVVRGTVLVVSFYWARCCPAAAAAAAAVDFFIYRTCLLLTSPFWLSTFNIFLRALVPRFSRTFSPVTFCRSSSAFGTQRTFRALARILFLYKILRGQIYLTSLIRFLSSWSNVTISEIKFPRVIWTIFYEFRSFALLPTIFCPTYNELQKKRASLEFHWNAGIHLFVLYKMTICLESIGDEWKRYALCITLLGLICFVDVMLTVLWDLRMISN